MKFIKPVEVDEVNLNYPSAIDWMWDHCVYLGDYTDAEGAKFDLGILLYENREPSAAIVYGNEPGDYLSGPFRIFGNDKGVYDETHRRALELNLIDNQL